MYQNFEDISILKAVLYASFLTWYSLLVSPYLTWQWQSHGNSVETLQAGLPNSMSLSEARGNDRSPWPHTNRLSWERSREVERFRKDQSFSFPPEVLYVVSPPEQSHLLFQCLQSHMDAPGVVLGEGLYLPKLIFVPNRKVFSTSLRSHIPHLLF